ncbi:MAG: DUF2029 domain-containing protein [Candidatus Dormibacteraeota bacterium]|nr:DUF2029 domain-containing protein [Candidatus Dormibacteraeota bacterium]
MTGAASVRAARLAWFGAGVAATIVALDRIVAWAQLAKGDVRGADFFSFYAAAKLVTVRGGEHLYEAGSQRLFQDQVTSAWPGHYVLLPFLHPPYYALLIAPLAALPFHTAYLVMAATSATLLGAALFCMLRAGHLGGAAAAWIATTMSVSFLPVFVVFLQGQSDMVVLLPLCLSFLFWVRGRPGWSGLCAGLAISKPQLLLLIPVVFVVRRSGRALAGYAAGAGGLLIASLPFFGIRGWAAYIGVIAPWVVSGDRHFPITGQTVFSLRGLLEGAPGGRPVALVLLVLAAVAAVVIIAARPPTPGLDMAFAVSASLLLSPYQNLHDLSLLLLPGLATVALARQGALRHPGTGVAILLVAYVAVDLTLQIGPQAAALTSLVLTLYLGWESLGPGPRIVAGTTATQAS